MSYQIALPTVALVAIHSAYAQQGVTVEDVRGKVEHHLRSELGKVAFAEAAKAAKPGSFKRLKLNAKAREASYSTRMAGSTKEVATKALDLYDWLADVTEFQMEHGDDSLPVVKVPKEIADYCGLLVGTMVPALA